MSNTINNGGPAFPADVPGHGIEIGMTLRDYFAGKVLPSVYSSAVDDAANGSGLLKNPDWRILLALESYSMADSMLRARGEA